MVKAGWQGIMPGMNRDKIQMRRGKQRTARISVRADTNRGNRVGASPERAAYTSQGHRPWNTRSKRIPSPAGAK